MKLAAALTLVVGLVGCAARNEIEVYAKGSCQDDWEGPHPYSG